MEDEDEDEDEEGGGREQMKKTNKKKRNNEACRVGGTREGRVVTPSGIYIEAGVSPKC